jgi:hypothetical protein
VRERVGAFTAAENNAPCHKLAQPRLMSRLTFMVVLYARSGEGTGESLVGDLTVGGSSPPVTPRECGPQIGPRSFG